MGPRLPRITVAELLRALRRDGWYEARQQATSHVILRHPKKPGRVVVPVHTGKTMPPGLLSSIISDAGLTADELRALL